MSDRDLNHLERSVRERWHCVVRDYYAEHGRRLEVMVTCTYRPPAQQSAAVAAGTSRRAPGTSRHNVLPCYAIDFLLKDPVAGMVVEGKTAREFELYRKVGDIAERHGFIWGGRWLWKHRGQTMTDPGHVEAPITVEAMQKGEVPAWPTKDSSPAT